MDFKIGLTMKNRNYHRKVFFCLLGLFISAFGMSLLIKSALGQSTVSALAYNLSLVTGIRTGTIVAYVNYLCLVGQIVLLKKDFKPFQLLQLGITFIFGSMVNFFLYDFFLTANLVLADYPLQAATFLVGIAIMAFGVALVFVADFVFLPFEGFCKLLASHLNLPFGKLRVAIDSSLVVISLVLIFTQSLPNTSIREGTLLYALAFGFLINFFLSQLNKMQILQQEDQIKSS